MNIQDWFPLGWTGWIFCSPRDSQESSPTPQFENISSLVLSLLYGPTLTSIHDTGKTIALAIWTFVGKVMSLLFNMLSRFIIALFSRNRHLLFHGCNPLWFWSPSNPLLLLLFPFYLSWNDGTWCHDPDFLNVEVLIKLFTVFFHLHQETLQFPFTFCL